MANDILPPRNENTLVPSFDLRHYVKAYDSAIPTDLLEQLQHQYEMDSDEWLPGRYGHVREADTIDICEQQSLSRGNKRFALVKALQEHTQTALERYIRSVGTFHGIPLVDRGFELIRYRPGHTCQQHYDYHLSGSTVNQFMVVSMVINVNDDYEGGEMSFWNGEVIIPAKRGTAIFFPSHFLFWHGITEVSKSNRLALVNWFDPNIPEQTPAHKNKVTFCLRIEKS